MRVSIVIGRSTIQFTAAGCVKKVVDSSWAVAAIVIVAVGLRGGMLSARGDQLSVDTDGYRAIARNVADGHGYFETDRPTAFRPPGYPMLLAAIYRLGGDERAVGFVHLLLGAGTVWLTIRVGRRLGLGKLSLVAGLLVAIDPLLVDYGTKLMTETSLAFLIALLLWVGISNEDEESGGAGLGNQLLLGFVFGLCCLCRPTVLAFGGLVVVAKVIERYRCAQAGNRSSREFAMEFLRNYGFVGLAAIATVSPWVVRNMIVMGRPILMTTHGGYTLLLGNNRAFYEDVVAQPWGTVWPETSFETWQSGLHLSAKPGEVVETEVERDRRLYERAWRNIRAQPVPFVRSCLLRIGRLWNIVPQRESMTGNRMILWGVGAFYSTVMLLMGMGLLSLKKGKWSGWCPITLLLVSFTVVHLLYWANMRMRAPLVPAIALLATYGLGRVTHLISNRQTEAKPPAVNPRNS